VPWAKLEPLVKEFIAAHTPKQKAAALDQMNFLTKAYRR
jgi:hypothetical protein